MTGSADKRVLLADPMGTRGGEERIIVELARRLPERGYNVALACDSAGPLLEELEPCTEIFHVDFNSGEWAAANAAMGRISPWRWGVLSAIAIIGGRDIGSMGNGAAGIGSGSVKIP